MKLRTRWPFIGCRYAVLLGTLFAFFVAPKLSADTVWLDDLDLRPIVQGWGKPQKNRAAAKSVAEAPPLRIKGHLYERGVGTVAESVLTVQLEGRAADFRAMVGVDDAKRGSARASVEFFVVGDGRLLWRSGVMHANEAAKACEVSVSGVRQLLLKVGDADDGDNDDFADWADARFTADDAKPFKTDKEPVPSPVSQYILTPPAPAAPRINGPSVFGVRPGSPFLYAIPATGIRPMEFSAQGLPAGLQLDPQTGRITGKLQVPGEQVVTLVARNAQGSAEKRFRIVCGETIALTPPMGWNSWNCYAQTVSAEKVKAAADAMVRSGLVEHGWSYVNIDDFWQNHLPTEEQGLQDVVGPFRDANGVLVPNARFPDMKGLADYLHERGLKAGLYSSPGPTTCGGCAGSWLHEAKDARTFAEWGFDFLKYDWCSYSSVVDGKVPNPANVPVRKGSQDDAYAIHPFRVMGGALRAQPRDIVFSLCQYGSNDVWKWGSAAGGSSWRTTGDVNDSWRSIKAIGFTQDKAAPYAKPGSWTDADMLILGWIGWGHPRPTSLSPDEQYSHVTLWCMLSSPLLIGCDVSKLDAFALGLLTNDEVLAVDQDELGKQATCVLRLDDVSGKVADFRVYAKPLADGSQAVAFFNLGAETVELDFRDFARLNLSGRFSVRDLWRQREVAIVDAAHGDLKLKVPGHGVLLYKFAPLK